MTSSNLIIQQSYTNHIVIDDNPQSSSSSTSSSSSSSSSISSSSCSGSLIPKLLQDNPSLIGFRIDKSIQHEKTIYTIFTIENYYHLYKRNILDNPLFEAASTGNKLMVESIVNFYIKREEEPLALETEECCGFPQGIGKIVIGYYFSCNLRKQIVRWSLPTDLRENNSVVYYSPLERIVNRLREHSTIESIETVQFLLENGAELEDITEDSATNFYPLTIHEKYKKHFPAGFLDRLKTENARSLAAELISSKKTSSTVNIRLTT